MRVLSRMDVSNIPSVNNAASVKEKLEALQGDKSQAKMEDFLED
jgi:hypothetical protein